MRNRFTGGEQAARISPGGEAARAAQELEAEGVAVGFRPSAARWFEIVVPREDAHDTVEALAHRGGVQFEWSGERRAPASPDALAEPIARYRALAQDYARFWPSPVFEKRCCRLPADASATVSLQRVTRWRQDAADLLEQVEHAEREQQEVGRWRPLLTELSRSILDLGAFAAAGPVLAGYCLVLPPAVELPADLHGLAATIPLGSQRILLGVLPREDLTRLRREVSACGGQALAVPEWFNGTAKECRGLLAQHQNEVDRRIERLTHELRSLADGYGIGRARGVLDRLDWFRGTANAIDCSSEYCWITGWTSEARPDDMSNVLRDVGVRGSVVFRDPPRDALPPSVTGHPGWLRPFEAFTGAIGVPRITEADPTAWVALLVPLIFGYMCGDVGHGVMIAAAGLALRRRTPFWSLLVICGAAAAGFGFAYGEIFGYGDIVKPLWVRPLDEPLTLLLIPMAGGAVVLTAGIALHAVQSCWRGEGRHRRVADAAQVLVYWGLLLAVLEPALGWLAAAGVVLCAANRLWTEHTPQALLLGIGQLTESTFTLMLNTLSFARVGAFALAHAALESTIFTLAAAVENLAATAFIVVAGNLLVVLLEGMVVMIQTTRLVLFEFFMRFFEGGGRPFLPASAPSAVGRSQQSR